jgi:CBS domain-containing protein
MTTDPRRLAAPPDTRDDDPVISAVMTTRIVAITPDAPVSTALTLMASAGVRHLPVLSGDRCRGVLHEADVIAHLAATPSSPVDRAATPVDRLTRPVPSLPVSARRSDAARSMDADMDTGMDAVLVTDRHRLVGIVTATDLIRSLAREAPQQPTGSRP